jgi:xanthine dehydrogenase YagT iron-sulfur-binding subunit
MDDAVISNPPDAKDQRDAATMSRRTFLKGTGLAVAGATAVETGLASMAVASAPGAASDSKFVGPGAIGISLNVNGRDRVMSISPATTLAEALRDSLELTGTKIGCDRGSCSACTVWLDGAPVAACMTLAVDVGERKVTTVEGLAQGDELHAVQAAFIAHDALQCGFCTPGLVMSCAALLAGNPNPTPDDVREATSGHLCRCGSLPHVLAATLDAAKAAKGRP